MKDKDISDLLKKANDSLRGARVLFNEGLNDFSASRSYYTMFYVAEALLLTKSLSFSKHKAVISFFGKEFVKSGAIPKQMHSYITDAFRYRQLGDYGISGSISRDKAKELMGHAEEFIKTINEFLRKEGYDI